MRRQPKMVALFRVGVNLRQLQEVGSIAGKYQATGAVDGEGFFALTQYSCNLSKRKVRTLGNLFFGSTAWKFTENFNVLFRYALWCRGKFLNLRPSLGKKA